MYPQILDGKFSSDRIDAIRTCVKYGFRFSLKPAGLKQQSPASDRPEAGLCCWLRILATNTQLRMVMHEMSERLSRLQTASA
jgi:hypothetical protein